MMVKSVTNIQKAEVLVSYILEYLLLFLKKSIELLILVNSQTASLTPTLTRAVRT